MAETNRSESIVNLAVALAIAQGEIGTATKDAKGNYSKYSTLNAMWDACRKPLSENGLSVIQIPSTNENGLTIETILLHSSGEWISGIMTLPVVAGRMNEHQAIGSALTYLRRYMLGPMIGISSGDDDDGQGGKILTEIAASRNHHPVQQPIQQEDNRPWQEKKPSMQAFMKMACDHFGLEEIDILDELKAGGFSSYKSSLAPKLWTILEKAQGDIEVDELAQDYPEIFEGDQPALIEDEPADTHYQSE